MVRARTAGATDRSDVSVAIRAIDRTHRNDQDNQVFAYLLIARDTVEEKVLQLQATKRNLADAIINADNSPFLPPVDPCPHQTKFTRKTVAEFEIKRRKNLGHGMYPRFLFDKN